MNHQVDFYFNKAQRWQEEIKLLRAIIIDCDLVEVLKWGNPCYTFENNNIVLIHVFKEYCALLFFKGALLKDPQRILIQQTANVQAARQIRFTSVEEVITLKSKLTEYIYEAIKVEEAGLKVDFKNTAEFPVSEEFKMKMKEISDLKSAFESLTPGRQRAYLLYFSQPKQSKTRELRVEKCIPKIFEGKGLND